MIGPAVAPAAPNTCGIAALSAILRISPEALLTAVNHIRGRFEDGTDPTHYVEILNAAGLRVEQQGLRYNPQTLIRKKLPLPHALAGLRGRKAILVIVCGKHCHAIAAEGFMVCDSGKPTPQWYADWHESRRFSKRWPKVIHAAIVEEK